MIEQIQAAIHIVRLVFTEVEVERVEDSADGDFAVEVRDEEPFAEVVARDVHGDSVPDFGGCAVVGGFVGEVDLLLLTL